MRIEVALLDFRDDELCDRYANYRSTAPFDHLHWNTEYVRAEVLSTILRLLDLKIENSLLEIELFLASRLSTFRIEGSSDAIIVTREDPKDLAARYPRNDSRYDAFRQEFDWIKRESEPTKLDPIKGTDYSNPEALKSALVSLFGANVSLSDELLAEALKAKGSNSPYVR